MIVINVLRLRLRLMYASLSVRALSVLLIILIGILINGLYSGAEDSTRLKIGVAFEKDTELTEAIYKALETNEIVMPVSMTKEEGIQAVTEGRIQGMFVFKKDMEEDFVEGEHEETVDLYLLEENFLPYLLADLVGSEMIGEISIVKAIEFVKEAVDDAGVEIEDEEAYYDKMYVFGKSDLNVEKDNFYVEKTYIMPDGSKDLSYIALENVLLFKQVILGVVYIFIAFFMLFLVVNVVRDDETGLRPRWFITPMARGQIVLGEYLSIIAGALPLIVIVTLIQALYEDMWLFFVVINLLFAVAFGGLLLCIGRLIDKVTVYVIVASAVIIILGIVSGSFFLVDTSNPALAMTTYLMPTYHLLREVVRVKLVEDWLPSISYIRYMTVFGFVTYSIVWLMEVLKRRRYS